MDIAWKNRNTPSLLLRTIPRFMDPGSRYRTSPEFSRPRQKSAAGHDLCLMDTKSNFISVCPTIRWTLLCFCQSAKEISLIEKKNIAAL